MLTGDKIREFLLAVVNGDDQSQSSEKRRAFFRRCHRYFPPLSDGPCLEADFRREVEWWNPNNKEIKVEDPHHLWGLHVAILRYKLRVIWTVANSKNWESAERRAGYLRTETHRYYRESRQGTTIMWRHRALWACDWLGKNVRRLKVCRNPSCPSPFFVREEKNQQYCGVDCAAEGQSLNWKLRIGPPKKKMTPEGSAAISKAQEERWQKYRTAKAEIDAEPSAGKR
jgi:hypothetical protein